MISLLINMHDFGGREAVKARRGGRAVRTDIRAVHEIAQFEIGGQLFRHRQHVERIAGRAEDRLFA